MSAHNIVHVEIPSTDAKANAKFYSDAFGWKLEHDDQFDYWQFRPEAGPGGGFPGTGEPSGGKIGELLVYIGTDDIEASRAFYSGLLGFNVSMEAGKFLMFTSPSDPNIQVSLNGDFDSLPAGFIVDVGTAKRVAEIHATAVENGLRIIEGVTNDEIARQMTLYRESVARVPQTA